MRSRPLLSSATIVLAAGLLILLLLTLLSRQLERPPVHPDDLAVQAAIHSLASPGLTRIMIAFTWIGSIKIFLVALALILIYLVWTRRRHAAALISGSILGALLLNETLKLHFHRVRPQMPWFTGDPLGALIPEEHTWSFPSGHALFAVTLYGTLLYLALSRPESRLRRIGLSVSALLLIAGIGVSRIYLGRHFPSDVFAGYVTGTIWLAAVILVDRRWIYSRSAHPAAPRT